MNELFDPGYSEARDLICDIARECPGLIMSIRECAARHGANWQHHIPAMQRAIEQLRKHCEWELEHLGQWRNDLSPDEIVDDLQREFCKLTRWLSRMSR